MNDENKHFGEMREIEHHMRDRMQSIAALIRLREAHNAADDADAALLEELGVEFEGGDPLEDQAERLLDEFPLSVEATKLFEIVLGTGGPDDRLIVECREGEHNGVNQPSYEIRRILYRYSWSGSAERELTGEDRETAEALARRVVPELVE